MNINELSDESVRSREFPVTAHRVFMAHAGVSPLPRVAADALREFAERGSNDLQENEWAIERVAEARRLAATLLGASAAEVALLGPTALGLNLVADGLPWREGDEVVFHADDYPANVYPWRKLETRGVRPIPLELEVPGRVVWPAVERALTDRTRLVALSTGNFLTGHRIDVHGIGRRLAERDILFCLDAIQTLGAFPVPTQHVDFLCAASHKWLLGPVGAGVFFVKSSRQDLLRPSLLGSWNVVSPNFIAQEEIRFQRTARRYEPGSLNFPGIIGMGASLRLLLDAGQDGVSSRVLGMRRALADGLLELGFRSYPGGEGACSDAERCGILSVTRETTEMKDAFDRLRAEEIVASLRHTRDGTALLRFSPHFYNTREDVGRVLQVLRNMG
jgi:cysteine desulfurase / selenocysteine lyase